MIGAEAIDDVDRALAVGDSKSLAKHAVKLDGWRWMPGMLGPDGFRITAVQDDPRGFVVVSRGSGWTAPSLQADFLPDLDDPATGGAMLHLIGEGASAFWIASSQRWLVMDTNASHLHTAPTLAAACIGCAVRRGYWDGEDEDGTP